MNSEVTKKFLPTIVALESMIRELEVKVGVEHKPSPFDQFVALKSNQPQDKQVQEHDSPVEAVKQESKVVESVAEESKVQNEKKQTELTKKREPKQVGDEQQKPKKEKKAAPVTESLPDLGDLVDLVNCDIRVGEIVECWKHPDSEKLWCERINVGTELREIASGLQQYIPIEQMSGLCCVLTNLKAKKLGGFMSNGMVLCSSNGDHTQVELMRPSAGSKVGERVKIQGMEHLFKDEIEPILNPKKKQWENVMPLLVTNDNLEGTFKGQLLVTSTGSITCKSLKQAHIS